MLFEPEYDSRLLNTEKADFILAEAKERLKYIHECSNSIDTKTLAFIQALLVITTGLIGFIFVQYDVKQAFMDQPWALLISTVYLVIELLWICYKISNNLKTQDYQVLGRGPETYVKNEYLQYSSANLKVCEAITYHVRIAANDKQNELKSATLNCCIGRILRSLIITIFGFIVLQFIFSSVCFPHLVEVLGYLVSPVGCR